MSRESNGVVEILVVRPSNTNKEYRPRNQRLTIDDFLYFNRASDCVLSSPIRI